jgi:CRISPR-associated protein Csx17
VPTPVLSPWNNGSGFGPKDKEPLRALEAVLAHPSPRLAPLREAIPLAREIVRVGRAEGWITNGTGDEKSRLVLEFRNRCPEALIPWIDAAVVLAGDGTFFPPLLGTGGNDGRLDFSTNFHQRLLEVIGAPGGDTARSAARARDLLDGTEDEQLVGAAVGQFDPGNAGGPGSSRFGKANALVNPWGFILLVEGSMLFAAGTARRHQHAAGRAAMPFTVYGSPDGSDSGAISEESRGEVWAPVWDRDFTLTEIQQLFGEARASWRGRPARRAADFYAATRSLGVARGIGEFARYGLQRRNGLAFAAVPLDRVAVREKAEVRLAAEVEAWVSLVRGGEVSSAVGGAVRRFDAAHLEFVRCGGALDLTRMLTALTELEQAVGRSGRTRDNTPVRRPPRAREFLSFLAAETPSPELRIAVGLASCATLRGSDQPRSMRQILLPVDPPGPSDRAAGRWRDAPVVPGFGVRPLPQMLAEILIWRSRTAPTERDETVFRGIPAFRSGIPVPAADLHALAADDVDEKALDLLLRACLALDWRGARHRWASEVPVIPVTTLALLHPFAKGLAPGQVASDEPVRALSPDWGRRLVAGQVSVVHDEAAVWLRQAGWVAVPAPPSGAAGDGVRIAAALVPRCLGSQATLKQVSIPVPSLSSKEPS